MTADNRASATYRRSAVLLALGCCLATLSACTSASLDAAAPQSSAFPAAPSRPTSTSPIASGGVGAPVNTGQFPSVGRDGVAATDQFTDEEQAALAGRLERARSTNASGRENPAAYAGRLKRVEELGRTHGRRALEQIENAE